MLKGPSLITATAPWLRLHNRIPAAPSWQRALPRRPTIWCPAPSILGPLLQAEGRPQTEQEEPSDQARETWWGVSSLSEGDSANGRPPPPLCSSLQDQGGSQDAFPGMAAAARSAPDSLAAWD